jgi:hypothetical protein
MLCSSPPEFSPSQPSCAFLVDSGLTTPLGADRGVRAG